MRSIASIDVLLHQLYGVFPFPIACRNRPAYTMENPVKKITTAPFRSISLDELDVLQEVSRVVPGSVHYTIRRYKKLSGWQMEDTGALLYHYDGSQPSASTLELRFCVGGNVYCRQKQSECDFCKFNESRICTEKVESVDVLSFTFRPSYLAQFVKGKKKTTSVSEDVLSFSHTHSFSRALPLCGKTRKAIEALLNHNYTDTLANIFVNAQTQILLLYSMDCMLGEREEVFTCKFLANAEDREKIIRAREVLLQHIGEPLTIRELSRKVAINECYLKKGFKELFGTTIFDFYQSQRMEHAKYLLYEKGLSVTEVSALLGYSSISHFSTAFKKHTGLKPCELLLR
jgi:AraC family transcriptional regulator